MIRTLSFGIALLALAAPALAQSASPTPHAMASHMAGHMSGHMMMHGHMKASPAPSHMSGAMHGHMMASPAPKAT
jgi:hypothetical protein